MDELILPKQLAGPWQHALIMTYGMDIPFFEGSLWREFRNSCRNKIVLADGNQLLNSFEHYAAGGLVRMLNQQYIAEGIFTPRAAHAKLVLLVHPEQGRLLVGSGNVGYGGYASGGELFTAYEYSHKLPSELNAFLAIREMVSSLVQGGYIQGTVVNRIERLWSETPWLYGQPLGDGWPVRHNLKVNFLAQLKEAVADETAEEIWVMSPFYDEECHALSQLLDVLRPKQTTLLVQRGRTSVSPSALSRVLDQSPYPCTVRAIHRPIGDPYVHAKFYLIKTKTRSICLQGSPNLSQVAMLLAHPHGNFEVANLLEAKDVHAFDYLLQQLDMEPTEVSLEALDLVCPQALPEQDSVQPVCRLRGGEWFDEWLVLRYHGDLPSLEGALLVIAEDTFPVVVQQHGPNWLKLKIDKEAAQRLVRPVSVLLRWGDNPNAKSTNPVFICNQAALNAVLDVEDNREVLGRIGNLDLDDDELEHLLGELDAALVIDGRSIWQLAGRPLPNNADANEGEFIDYATINYDQIRQHPKVLQYLQRHGGQGSYTRSRLQIILNAITDHFRGFIDISTITQLVADPTQGSSQPQGETEAEAEEAEHERERRRRSDKQRVGRLLTNFIQRYLRGIASSDFQSLVGFEVMTQNYIIFGHLLWRLLERDWIEPKVVLSSFLDMWKLFWGTAKQGGYWSQLDESQQAWGQELIREHHGDAQFLATLYTCARLSESEPESILRIALRKQWRFILVTRPLAVTPDTLEYMWRLIARGQAYDPPRPPAICDVLARLANLESRDHFLRALEQRHNVRAHSCHIERIDVFREKYGREVAVECLCVPAKSWLADSSTARRLIQRWLRAEPNLDYYRIHAPGAKQIIFFDKHENEVTYWDKENSEPHSEFVSPKPLPMPWDPALEELLSMADALDHDLTLPMVNLEHAASEFTADIILPSLSSQSG